MSPDPTLKNGTFSSCRNSTAIYKNPRGSSFSRLFRITVLKTGEEPHMKRKTPLAQQEGLSQQLESRHRFVMSCHSNSNIPSFISTHPFVQQTLRAGTHWLWATGKEWEPWPDLPSPGAWSPSKQMKKGHDLILTQQSRQWASESPSKALSFPQDQTAGREAISILDKNRKNGAFDGLALTHWSTAGGAHQTQALSDLKLCCPQKKRTSVTFLDTTSLRLPL